MALLGQFEQTGTVTMWPTQEVFMTSYRWTGAWTASLEDWFQAHLERIASHTFMPMGVNSWKAEFRAPSPLRKDKRDQLTADDLASPIVAEARESGLFEDTILATPGCIPADTEHVD